jgi:hypothetical protein
MDDVANVFGRIFGRFIGPTDEPDALETTAANDVAKKAAAKQGPHPIPPAIAAE